MQFQMFDAKNTYNAQGTAAKADPRLVTGSPIAPLTLSTLQKKMLGFFFWL